MITSSAFSEIIEIQDFEPLQGMLRTEATDSLVIFDVDHVLIMPTEEYSLNRNPQRKVFWEQMKNELSDDEVKYYHSIVTHAAEWRLVDPKIINVLNDLKERSIPTIALTSLSTGKLGIIEKRENLRIQELNGLGINFLELNTIKGEILIPEMEKKDGIPMLKDGVIFTAEVDKAIVLEHILIKSNYNPKTIIFIDDMLKNVESVEKLCKKLGIKYTGFHYTAVSYMKPKQIDHELEKIRFEILKTKHRWLNYTELKDFLSK